MELQLVTFEQAKVLKELGFPQEQYIDRIGGYIGYSNYGRIDPNNYHLCRTKERIEFYAPSLELIAKWLREEKDIKISIYYNRECTYVGDGYQIYVDFGTKYNKLFNIGKLDHNYIYHGWKNSFEEALSAGVDKALEILKQKI